MKQIVFRISCIVVCVSVMLSVFILPVSALGTVNYEFDTIPPFGSSSLGMLAGFYVNSDGRAKYVELLVTTKNVTVGSLQWACSSDGRLYGVYQMPADAQGGSSLSFTYNIYNSDGTLERTFSETTYPRNVNSGVSEYSILDARGGSSSYVDYLYEMSFYSSMGNVVGAGVTDFYLYPSSTKVFTSAQNIPFTFTINGEEYDDGSGGGSGSADLTETNSWLEKIYNKLCEIFTFLPELKNNGSDEVVSSVNDVKDSIDKIADAEPSNPLDNDGMNEFESAVGEVQSTIPEEELSNMMGNVDMSGRPIEWIYQQLEDFVSGNNKVFSVYMAILSMSFIMFVLNKGSNVRSG